MKAIRFHFFTQTVVVVCLVFGIALFMLVPEIKGQAADFVAYWTFDESSGNPSDSSTNNNDGTLVNGPTWQPSGGQIGGALKFDGINDYVRVPDSASLSPTSAMTISMWFNPDATLSPTSDHYHSLLDNGVYNLFFDKSDGHMKFALNSATAESWKDLAGVSPQKDKVLALQPYKGDLYIGGLFVDSALDRIGKWNGTSWTPVGTGDELKNGVEDFAVYKGDLYIGGRFSDAAGIAGADKIAKWNGSSWSELAGGVSSNVRALAVYKGDLYVGGEFSNVAGNPLADKIAKWNGSSWSDVGGGYIGGNVYALVVHNGELYAGGSFSGKVAKWNGSSWSTVPGMGGSVWALGTYDGELYAGGDFTNAGGDTSADRIAKWNGSSWVSVGGAALNSSVYAFTVYNGELYVGGKFTGFPGLGVDRVAKWNGSSWSSVGGVSMNNRVDVFGVYDGELYIGGDFTNGAGTGADGIVRYSSGNDIELDSSTTSWAANTWHHVAATYDGSTARIYIDGVEQNSKNSSFTIKNLPYDLLIGKRYGLRAESQTEEPFKGKLDDVRLYDRSLPPEEILSLFVGGPTKVGEARVQGPSGVIILPLFDPADSGLTSGSLRIQTPSGIRVFDLLLTSDPNASPVRIQTPAGIRAIRQ